MKERKTSLRDLVFRNRPAPNSLKILLVLLILFSMAALVALRWVHNGIRAEIDSLTGEAAAIEHANTVLDERTQKPDDPNNIRDYAREELGLVDEDSIVFDPQ